MSFPAVRQFSGTGSPEGTLTAPYGSIYYQTDATAGNELWEKGSGTGNSGWRQRGTGAYLDANNDLSITPGSPTSLDAVDTVGALKALTGMGDGVKRIVMGYYAVSDGGGGEFRFNASSSATDDGGTVITPTSGSGRWERINIAGDWDLAWFGVLPSRSDTQNSTAIQTAVTSAGAGNSLLTGVALVFGAGEYSVSGGITLPHNVDIKGRGSNHTIIYHTGDNTLFESLESVTDIRILRRRKFEGFLVWGTGTKTVAKVIRMGNYSHGAICRDVQIDNYSGASTIGIEIANTITFSEGTVIEHCQIRNCKKNVAFTRTSGTNSFSDTRIMNLLSVAFSGQTCLWFDDNTWAYGSTINAKLFMSVSGATGLRLGTSTWLRENHYNIFCELVSGSNGVSTTSSSILSGSGTISPQPSSQGVDGSLVPLHNIHPMTEINLSDHQGSAVQTEGETSIGYFGIGTLPTTGAGTLDKMHVEVWGGPDWLATSVTKDDIILANRGTSSSSIVYQYGRSGRDDSSSRLNLRVVAYEQGDGTVQVYVKTLANSTTAAWVRARSIGAGPTSFVFNWWEGTALTVKPRSTTTPSGTLVFDSGDSATYAPNMRIDMGDIRTTQLYVAGTEVIRPLSNNERQLQWDFPNASWGVTASDTVQFGSRILVMPTSTDISSDGYISFTVPTSGVLLADLVTNRASGNGVQLLDYETLWAQHTRGGSSTAGTLFRITDYTDTATYKSFADNPNWYRLCWRNGDDASLHLADGRLLKPGERIVIANVPTTVSSPQTVANTVTETVLGSLSLASAEMVAGTTYRIVADGVASTTGAPGMTFALRIGSAVVGGAQITSWAPTAGTGMTNLGWHLDALVTCRSTGSSGTVMGNGWLVDDFTTTVGQIDKLSKQTTTATVDTTVGRILGLTFTWGTANASNTLTCHNLVIQPLKY